MILLSVHYIPNTLLSILADPSNADFWIKVIDVSTSIPFKFPFNRNGTFPKPPLQLVQLFLSLPTFFLILLHDRF